jgi:hypothetical protein
MVEWSQSDPGAGSTAAMGSTMSNLKTAQSKLGSAHDAATKAVGSVSEEVWTGASVASWQASTKTAVDSFFGITGVFAMAHSAIGAYQLTVESIQRQAAALTGELHDAARLRSSIPVTGYDWQPPLTDEEQKHKALAASKEADAQQGLQRLANLRREADETLASALRQSVPSTWKAEQKAFEAVGITGASQINTAAIVAAMVKLTQYSAAHAGLSDPAALLGLLDTYSNDPVVLNAFYQKLGGANTVDLITMLGKSVHPGGAGNAQSLAIAEQIRNSLSLVSRDWSQIVGAQFGDSMFNGKDPEAGTPSANEAEEADYIRSRAESIGFLFDGLPNAPMGQTLTVEMASRVVAWEKLTHSDFISTLPLDYQGSGATGGAEVSAGRLSQLEELKDQKLNLEGSWLAGTPGKIPSDDATGRILETLGHYPQAAQNFLTDPTYGADRVKQIFGTRDWSAQDGYQGPAALWLGAEQAKGGPFSPNETVASATLTSHIMWDLAKNPEFHPSVVSATGSAILATAIAPNLDGIGEQIRLRSNNENAYPGASSVAVFGGGANGPKENVPEVSGSVVATLLGAAGYNKAGRELLQQAISNNQAIYAAAAKISIDHGVTNGILGDALERSKQMQGMLAGASGQAAINEAIQHDSDIDADFSMLSAVVGAIPIPGLGALVGGSKLIDAAQSVAVGQAESFGLGAWQNSLHTTGKTTAEIAARNMALNIQQILKTSAILNSVDPGLGGQPPTQGLHTLSAYEQTVDNWWDEHSAKVQQETPISGVDMGAYSGDYGNIVTTYSTLEKG